MAQSTEMTMVTENMIEKQNRQSVVLPLHSLTKNPVEM